MPRPVSRSPPTAAASAPTRPCRASCASASPATRTASRRCWRCWLGRRPSLRPTPSSCTARARRRRTCSLPDCDSTVRGAGPAPRPATAPGPVPPPPAVHPAALACTTHGRHAAPRRSGHSADSYHAGLPMLTRRRVQNRFMAGTLRIVVATMGALPPLLLLPRRRCRCCARRLWLCLLL